MARGDGGGAALLVPWTVLNTAKLEMARGGAGVAGVRATREMRRFRHLGLRAWLCWSAIGHA